MTRSYRTLKRLDKDVYCSGGVALLSVLRSWAWRARGGYATRCTGESSPIGPHTLQGRRHRETDGHIHYFHRSHSWPITQSSDSLFPLFTQSHSFQIITFIYLDRRFTILTITLNLDRQTHICVIRAGQQWSWVIIPWPMSMTPRVPCVDAVRDSFKL